MLPFDNDDILDESDDEDLKNDPVCQMDVKVRPSQWLLSYLPLKELSVDALDIVLQRVRSQKHKQLQERHRSDDRRGDDGCYQSCAVNSGVVMFDWIMTVRPLDVCVNTIQV